MERQKIVDEDKKITEVFMHGVYDLHQLYKQYETTGDKYADVINKIEAHFNPPANVHLNRFKFREILQYEAESFNDYVTRVRNGAKVCKFEKEDDEIVSQIIQRCRSTSLKDKSLNMKTTPILGLIKSTTQHN